MSTLSLTLAVDGAGGLRHASAALPPGKRPGTHFCIHIETKILFQNETYVID
jgi:hypothetical protein